jgi:Tol biopolymer transport system component
VNSGGRLAVIDKDKNKQQVEGTKNVILPAWSTDGSKIAFLEKAGKNKYELYVAAVSR